MISSNYRTRRPKYRILANVMDSKHYTLAVEAKVSISIGNKHEQKVDSKSYIITNTGFVSKV